MSPLALIRRLARLTRRHYVAHMFPHPPKGCRTCRLIRDARRLLRHQSLKRRQQK